MANVPNEFQADGLPELTWSDYSWRAEDRLRSWVGFQSRGGAYGAPDHGSPSSGRVRVSIKRPLDRHTPPHDSQLAAYRWLREHEGEVTDAILAATLRDYPSLRSEWLTHYPDEETRLPPITSPADLRLVMGLHDVHVLAIARDGSAYVGFEFGCNWDDEHGYGVVTHRNRVIEIGGADVSFHPTKAVEADGGEDLEP